MKRRILIAALLLIATITACGRDDDAWPSPSGTTSATVTRSASPTPSRSAAPSSTGTLGPTAGPTDTPAPTDRPPYPEPVGFPIDPQTRLGIVTGSVGSRTLVFDGGGPSAIDYATNDQPSDDGDRANLSGWNCRVHYEYESAPAVDFYIPEGTTILATMDGTATLYIVSWRNDFDRYGVSREPYIGNPDRSRAPITPFPAQSGGMGVYVVVRNDSFVTEYGHLNIDLTIPTVPADAYVDGYRPVSDYHGLFSEVPQPRIPTAIAEWPVRAGDVLGMSGDTGYSEGPHVHYTVSRTAGGYLCPTSESVFSDGGWLTR